jgi:hypothetical protein
MLKCKEITVTSVYSVRFATTCHCWVCPLPVTTMLPDWTYFHSKPKFHWSHYVTTPANSVYEKHVTCSIPVTTNCSNWPTTDPHLDLNCSRIHARMWINNLIIRACVLLSLGGIQLWASLMRLINSCMKHSGRAARPPAIYSGYFTLPLRLRGSKPCGFFPQFLIIKVKVFSKLKPEFFH